jgi:ABC-2 type transport system ATP-binding protein
VKSLVVCSRLSKTFRGGVTAVKDVDLDIHRGEIFALLGLNGAGKTTLISAMCGLVRATSGTVTVAGHDIVRDYKKARNLIGLVPQELSLDVHQTIRDSVRFTRGLYGKRHDAAYLESLLRSLSLWDRRDSRIIALSGGMKRRVLIAKALSHEPRILFLDEPTAGVDLELRKNMWRLVGDLKSRGVTIVLTTHHIEEAEEMADRVCVMRNGEVLFIDEKKALMERLGKKRLTLHLSAPLDVAPPQLERSEVTLHPSGQQLVYTFHNRSGQHSVTSVLTRLQASGLQFTDIEISNSSLEEILFSAAGTSQ